MNIFSKLYKKKYKQAKLNILKAVYVLITVGEVLFYYKNQHFIILLITVYVSC